MDNSIRKYSPEGQLLVPEGIRGTEPLQFSSPDGIAVNTRNNKVYVVDCGDHHIQVLNSDLTFLTTLGKQGEGRGQFRYPSGIACDGAGNVYVADCGNNRVQVFSAEGKFLRMFGKSGEGKGELSNPIGIALDPNSKHAYVSEMRISAFTYEQGCR